MGCCGGGRASRGHQAAAFDGADRSAGATVAFRYLGSTTLHVIGGATGRQYRFEGFGAELMVDPRDAPGISAVPTLRRIIDDGPWRARSVAW